MSQLRTEAVVLVAVMMGAGAGIAIGLGMVDVGLQSCGCVFAVLAFLVGTLVFWYLGQTVEVGQ